MEGPEKMDIKCLASGSKGNCYIVDDSGTKILIEAGISWKKIQIGLDFKTYEISAMLLSHSHRDHSGYTKDVAKAGIDCYMSQATKLETGLSGHRIKAVEAKKEFQIETTRILPFQLIHDVENLGFLIVSRTGEKLAYITDTMYCSYNFNGLTHIMIEANYAEDILRQNVIEGRVPNDLKNRLLRSHMSLETCKDFLRLTDLSRVREIWLIHSSEGNSDTARFRKEVQQLTGKPVYIP